jgi:DNA-binding NtrC family response regulator
MYAVDAPGEEQERDMRAVVLVVEDQVIIRMSLCDSLRDAGFHVIEASNADEALKVLRSGAELQLLLTDVYMPGPMDGLRLAAVAQSMRPGLKIVVASAELSGLEASDAFPHEFVSKPFEMRRLIARLRELTGPPREPEQP